MYIIEANDYHYRILFQNLKNILTEAEAIKIINQLADN